MYTTEIRVEMNHIVSISKIASESRYHGHTWDIEIGYSPTDTSEATPDVDLVEIHDLVRGYAETELRGKCFVNVLVENSGPEFIDLGREPSALAIARYLFQSFQALFMDKGLLVNMVVAKEGDYGSATYTDWSTDV
jgi:6-pyruvoyl-tetrahydropterin synthase